MKSRQISPPTLGNPLFLFSLVSESSRFSGLSLNSISSKEEMIVMNLYLFKIIIWDLMITLQTITRIS